MRNSRLLIGVGCWLAAGSLAVWGTTAHKAGLWEITTTMTWQESPQVPGSDGSKLPAGTHTTQVCLTQEMIDDYGALLPQGRGSCTIRNRSASGDKLTGDYLCSGVMTGKGVVESNSIDADHVTGKVHFMGTFLVGGEQKPIEWTNEMKSTFKSANCGLIKPQALPKH